MSLYCLAPATIREFIMRIVNFGSYSLVAFLLLGNASAQDQHSCAASSIKGTYGFVSSVRLVPPPNSPAKHTERARFIGVINYDGAGNVTVGGVTIDPTGKSSSYGGAGTYTVDPQHCTGSVSFQDAQGNNKAKWDFVIVSGGSQLLTIIETASNTSPFSQVKR
jgi:hypothetical protein